MENQEREDYLNHRRGGIGLILYVTLIYCCYMPFMNLTSRIIGEDFLKAPPLTNTTLQGVVYNVTNPNPTSNQTYYLIYVIILTVGLMIGSYLAMVFYKNTVLIGSLISFTWQCWFA